MARYIDADILLDKLYDHEFITLCPLDEVSDVIDYCPTVEAEPVRHGRWIDGYNGKYANPRYICSNCRGKALYDFVRDELGNWKEVQALTEFCPHCGAKMDKVE